MKPIAPLMIEHRMIERMLAILGRERRRISQTGAVDRAFLASCLDFFKIYVDQFHHGKEEDILFGELERKPLSPGHRTMLQGLLADHVRGRSVIDRLERTMDRDRLAQDDIRQITEDLDWLLASYPAHIAREDKEFFLPAMNYFSEQEQQGMLKASDQFERKFTHRRYEKFLDDLEEREAA